MVGGVKRRNTKSAARRVVQRAAQRCLKRLMWVDSQLVGNERFQKAEQVSARLPWTAAIVSLSLLQGVPSTQLLRSNCRRHARLSHDRQATRTAMRQMETPSHDSGATPLSKRQEVTAEQ